jgi:hypothetical protein
MNYPEVMSEILRNRLPDVYGGLLMDVEFYTREPGFGLQGDYLDEQGNFICYANCSELVDSIGEIVYAWNKVTLATEEQWNKAQFIVYRTGKNQMRSWWDQRFQEKIYRNR